ncbi:hypothetical protein F5X68DRAFT_251516 [Plectosphaerella plurivora]|uniref:Heterokaryon incompatibility domain-containing protein n=1 Tax=Plectosphaerella plurivora TaxID=936078 RepID=A0A9P9A4V9_9PEZI|nr:hypothetical protein F5X68DRAFT_251516 [Plectosphaerella plurivora]
MEHLFYIPESPEGTVSAFKSDVLSGVLQDGNLSVGVQAGAFNSPMVEPRSRWLGFRHDDLALTSFADYPRIAGFLTAEIWSGKVRDASPLLAHMPGDEVGRAVASLLQSWLVFGQLEDFVGKKIMHSYLTARDPDDGEVYMNTQNLHHCLQATVFRLRLSATGEARQTASMKIQGTGQNVHQWTFRCGIWAHESFRPQMDEAYPGFMDLVDEMIPVAVRVAEAIEQTRMLAFPECPTIGRHSWHYSPSATMERSSKLAKLGWCGFQIRFIEDTLNQSTIDWLAAYGLRQDPSGHEACSSTACTRNDIDTATYTQAHRCQNPMACEKIKPDLKAVVDVLLSGMIPVVSVRRCGPDMFLDVRAASRHEPTAYIAFSHVWADGLGGATEKGLNRCQVDHLDYVCRKYRSTESEPAWFWLDALCIPSKDEVGKEVYSKALVAIRDVYLMTTAVLVLDKSIEACLVTEPTERLYASVYLSAWMQRMWTYEEAVLARTLVFVLRDGFHVYSATTEPFMRKTVSVVWQSLGAELFRLRAGQRLNIGHIARAFRYRLTNVTQEEFISVAGMLDLDAERILNVKGEEARAACFWLMLKQVPQDIPFLRGPKLSVKGFGWASRTLMTPSATVADTEHHGPSAVCTSDGLTGSYVVVKLSNTLRGFRTGAGESVFYLWVDGDGGEAVLAAPKHALLRVYCVDTWPESPEGLHFDAIYMTEASAKLLRPGQWIAGASALESVAPTDDKDHPRRFAHVHRVVVERMEEHELLKETGSVLASGSAKTIIDCVCTIERICIS